MAGYLSGIVWGGLFTAAGLAVVSELTLPSGLGATAANSAEAPVAAEQPTETVATAEPEVAPETPAEPAPETASEEPADAAVEPAAAESDTESAVQTEATTETAEAAPAEPAAVVAPEVDLPPIVSVTADQAAAQIAANAPVPAPEASSEAPADATAVATTEAAEPVVTPEAESSVAAQAAPDAPAEPEVAEASPAAPEQRVPEQPVPEQPAAEVAAETTETVDADAAAAALVETNPAATGASGDEAELAAMEGDTPRAGVVMPGQVPGRTFGDGDDAEGMIPVDEAALESAVSDNAPPAATAETATPAAETEAPVAPEAEQTEVAAAPEVATLTEIPAETAEDAPALQSPEATAEDVTEAPQIDTAPAAEDDTQMASAEDPAKGELPRKIQTEGQRAAEQAAADAAAQPAPDATAEPAETAGSLEPSRLRNSADGVVTNRLPRIGDDAGAKVETVEADAAAEDEKLPPMERFGTKFENTEKQPVLAVVLVDGGASQSLREQVTKLPFPVAVALDPLAPDAAEASAFYRGAGVEIVMLATGLPRGAEATDVEVTFATHAEVLPEAVAVMDTEQGGFQNNRPLATLVAPTVNAQGLGLITWDQGLNAGDQVARREGMSAGLIFRRFDEAGNNDTGMRRTLDRAALKAGQDGATIVAGMVNAQSLQSLVAWTLGAKGQAVAMAPVSSAMDTPEDAEKAAVATE